MEPDVGDGEFHDVADDFNSGSETDTADEAEFTDALDNILIKSGLEPVSQERKNECQSDSIPKEERTPDQNSASGDRLSNVEHELDALKLEIEQLNSDTDTAAFLSKDGASSAENNETPLTASRPLADRLNQEEQDSQCDAERQLDDDSDPETEKSEEKEIIEDKEALRQRELRESQLSEEELQQRKDEAQELKTQGNNHFKAGEHDEAVTCYTNALDMCPLRNAKERSIMYSNRAACKLHQEKHKAAIDDCSKALELNPMYMKALLRRAELYEKTEKLDEALTDYQKALELDPSLHIAREACMRLPEMINERNEKLKEEMFSKLKDLGNMVLRPFGLSTNNFQLTQDPNTGGYSMNFQQNAPPPPAPSTAPSAAPSAPS